MWVRCNWFPSSTTTLSTSFADRWRTAGRTTRPSRRRAPVRGLRSPVSPNSAGFVYEETTPELADNFSYIRGAHSFKFGASTHAIRDTQVQQVFAQYNFPSVAAYLAEVNG